MPPLAPTIGGRKEKMRAAGKEGYGRPEKEPERKAAGKGKQPVRRNRPVSRNPQKS
jgi:hypothetical protein